MTVLPSQETLASQVESFRRDLDALPRAATLKDAATRLTSTVRELFPGASVDVGLLAPGSQAWSALAGSAESLGAFHARLKSGGTDGGSIGVFHTSSDRTVVGLLVTRSDAGVREDAGEGMALRILMQMFDGARREAASRKNEKELVFSLNHRILQLNSLIDTGIEVAKLDEGTVPLRLALERAASLTNATAGAFTVESDGALLERHVFPAGAAIPSGNRVDRGWISSEFTFQAHSYTLELYQKESRSGPIGFEETDQLILDALARQVHASIENRYLHLQALEKQRIEQELSVAASIQKRIIPETLPEIPGYDVAGINIPSKSVGGDYYDCLKLSDGRYLFVIADVAGKGVPSALLVSSLHAYLAAFFERSQPLHVTVSQLNKALYRDVTEDKFVTAFFALLDPATGGLECLSAGHNPAFLLKKTGPLVLLHTGGLPLASVDLDIPYESEHVAMDKGDRLFLYTDGITEAENAAGEMFERITPFEEYIVGVKAKSARGFIDEVVGDVRHFAAGYPQNDDVTAIYLMRL